jgi:hypothetical protein
MHEWDDADALEQAKRIDRDRDQKLWQEQMEGSFDVSKGTCGAFSPTAASQGLSGWCRLRAGHQPPEHDFGMV